MKHPDAFYPRRVRRDLRLVLGEGVAFSVMVGMGESYLAAFVLALGLGEIQAGLIATIPMLAGGVIQLLTPLGVNRVGSPRRWSVVCAVVQALSFVPLLLGAVRGAMPAWAVFTVASVYWAAGMAIAPAWNAWVERLVPRRVRARYFAVRTGAVQGGVLAALVLGGLVLDGAVATGRALAGFAMIFAVAGVARGVSAGLFAAQSDAPSPTTGEVPRPAFPLLRRVPTGAGARLLLYLLALTGATMIAGPFFSPYMLVELDLSYTRYMILVGAAFVGKAAAFLVLAKVAKRIGLRGLLAVAWGGISLVPAIWLLSDAYPYLLGVQVFSGVFWAAHEYTSFLLLFETIQARRRIAVLTTYNLANAIATVVGSAVGATLLARIGAGREGYVTVFLVSALARLLGGVLLAQVQVGDAAPRPLWLRPIAVRPVSGAMFRPILASIRRKRERGREAS